jgi:hypothetical protein
MASSKKAKMAKLAGNGGGPDRPSGRFWTQWIEPKSAALLSETLGPVHFVVKNRASNNVLLVAENGDVFDVSPDTVRATYARGTIRVENPGEKPALIEFEFLPIYLKH